MEVAVTGASGVVGRPLVEALTAAGHRVRALVRSRGAEGELRRAGMATVTGDILDRASLQALVDGCELVFNVAGVNQLCVEDSTEMERVNVEGVANVIAACSQAGVRRLVHTSSAVTIGEEKGEVATEASRHRGYFLSEYERTKYRGEQVALAGRGDLEVVVVNPSSVQGPGRATGTGKLILDIVSGRRRTLVESRVSLVDIDDCARGHMLAAERGKPGERYILSGSTLGVAEAVAMAAEVAGLELSPRFVPGALVAGALALVYPVAKLAGRQLPFCPEMVRVMRFGHAYDGSRARRDLGLAYTTVEETMRRTVAWFRSEGLLAV